MLFLAMSMPCGCARSCRNDYLLCVLPRPLPPLYGDLVKPLICSLFIAIDIGHFRRESEPRSDAAAALARLRNSKSNGGTPRTPGERGWTQKDATAIHIATALAAICANFERGLFKNAAHPPLTMALPSLKIKNSVPYYGTAWRARARP
jgi:hypothetical protein